VPPPDYVPGVVPTSQDGPVAAPEIPQTAEQERVKLTGRLGNAPRFTTLASGNLRARFALAEHREDGSTTWHTVYNTGRYAERLRAKPLQKGVLVEVTGSRQVTTVGQDDGSTKQVESIFCYGVSVLGGPTLKA